MASAIGYLHSLNIVYRSGLHRAHSQKEWLLMQYFSNVWVFVLRDLKPENILLDSQVSLKMYPQLGFFS